MRPKVVILMLGSVLGLVIILALLKGVIGGTGNNAGGSVPPVSELTEPAPSANKKVQKGTAAPISSNAAAIVEQVRVAEVEKELERIHELISEGVGNTTVTPLLLAKITNPEPEVRKAAVQALVQLNDTNAIAGLEQAVALIEDPREKVEILDAVNYLKLPSAMPDVTPETDSGTNNAAVTVDPNAVDPNKAAEPDQRKQIRRPTTSTRMKGQPANQAQPAVPATGAQPK
jgi:hypothetical protein